MGFLQGLGPSYALALEEFPLDRMIDEMGERQKDLSHADSRWLYRTEVERILGVDESELEFDDRYRQSEKTFGETIRLHLASLDEDQSGFLEGAEYEGAGGAIVDLDGNQRISLLELARQAGALHLKDSGAASSPSEPSAQSEPSLMAGRVFEDGDLACLLDGLNPFAFDRNKDSLLKRSEADAAMFSALDLDGDESLSMAEMSRYPGEARQLRYGDALAERWFQRLDRNGDRKLKRREFRMLDAEWEALDADGDGSLRLLPGSLEFQIRRGLVMDGSEWPQRRRQVLPLPPNLSKDRLLAVFDADADGHLQRREMRARPELFVLQDRNGDGVLDEGELERLVVAIEQGRVDACPDDFEGRWDLDGSGAVEAEELPRTIYLRIREHL